MATEPVTGIAAAPTPGGSLERRLARAAAALAEAETAAGLRPNRASPIHSEAGVAQAARSGDVTDVDGDGPGGGADARPGDLAGTKAEPDVDPEERARAIVLRQLGMAARSRAQLEQKLRQRGVDDSAAARVLDRLTEVGLVDDRLYAEMLVREKQAGRGLARRALAHELRQKGVDRSLADQALSQVGPADERVRAEALAAKKLRTMAGLTPDVQARRLAGMLARKGYSGEVAWPVIRDGIEAAPEHQRD